MFALLLVIHILIAVLLVAAILLQSGQSGGLSGAFGGGGGGAAAGNQSLFGGRGAASFLSKATTYLGAGFMLISLLLAYMQAHRTAPASGGRNIFQEQSTQQAAPQGMPGQPAEAPASGTGAPGAPPGGASEGLLPPGETPAAAPTEMPEETSPGQGGSSEESQRP
ncbi:MAG: preprotein translocase subunit SecG [Candidatus Eisenbacteria bacterium]|nr:preprotein translocase subunit SecG [Candidatus Eisenbacteria bacterium]